MGGTPPLPRTPSPASQRPAGRDRVFLLRRRRSPQPRGPCSPVLPFPPGPVPRPPPDSPLRSRYCDDDDDVTSRCHHPGPGPCPAPASSPGGHASPLCRAAPEGMDAGSAPHGCRNTRLQSGGLKRRELLSTAPHFGRVTRVRRADREASAGCPFGRPPSSAWRCPSFSSGPGAGWGLPAPPRPPSPSLPSLCWGPRLPSPAVALHVQRPSQLLGLHGAYGFPGAAAANRPRRRGL